MAKPSPFTAKYLLERTEVNERGCWIWTGSLGSRGYPRGKENMQVHRAAYEHYKGPIPAGAELDHRCHNHACCNPDHLEPVTKSENLFRQSNYRQGQMARSHLRVARLMHKMVVKGRGVLLDEIQKGPGQRGRI